MKNHDNAIDGITDLLENLRALIVRVRKMVARGVDLVQVTTNFEIGRQIIEQEQRGVNRAEYGKEVLKVLAERLTAEFGNGFSRTNLEYMRRFYLLYRDRTAISQTLSGELPVFIKPQTASGKLAASKREQDVSFTLGWSHYILLMGIKNADERSFYEIEAGEQGWTVRELKRQFSSGLYERLALSRDKEGVRRLAQEGQVVSTPHDLLKEPYILEFLGLEEKDKYSESEMESAIINKIEHFLLELGKGFLFEARQKRFTYAEDHFYVDLVFYNRLLHCFVLIDLKIGKLSHQDLGQMQMYVNYFDRFVKTDAESPTIGIVLCKKKHTALVEITLPKDANIHAREYQLYLPTKEELQQKLEEWVSDKELGDE